MLLRSLVVVLVCLPISLCRDHTHTNTLRGKQKHLYRKYKPVYRRTFYGLTQQELVELHLQHEDHLNLLSLAGHTVGDAAPFYFPLHNLQGQFSWSLVNRTCPEIDWTFQYQEPFLHMSLPVCGDVIQPKMELYYGTTMCEVDPFYLPNNKTSACSQLIFQTNQIEEVVIITHGFLKDISSSWMHELASLLVEQNTHTAVLLVGWGRGSGGLPYPDPFYYYQAAANTRYMGVALGRLLMNLGDQVALLTNRVSHSMSFHCIGHSLGAHICGFLGKHLNKYTHLKLRRISGLDPAGPLFASDVPYPFNFISISETARLNKDDAGFVDVIHTDGRARFSFEVIPQYGTMLELGHVDFYPGSFNEFGWNQPGCWQVADIGSCSHSRSHDLYLSSYALPCHALQKCDNTTVIPIQCTNITTNSPTMGFWAETARERFEGIAFTVLTDAKFPYCTNTTTF